MPWTTRIRWAVSVSVLLLAATLVGCVPQREDQTVLTGDEAKAEVDILFTGVQELIGGDWRSLDGPLRSVRFLVGSRTFDLFWRGEGPVFRWRDSWQLWNALCRRGRPRGSPRRSPNCRRSMVSWSHRCDIRNQDTTARESRWSCGSARRRRISTVCRDAGWHDLSRLSRELDWGVERDGEQGLRMRCVRAIWGVALFVGGAILLAGCGTDGVEVENQLTWQEAKRQTQATELEIASMIPEDQVVSIEQLTKGTLLSCDSERRLWAGRTTVVLVAGADVDGIVRVLADAFREGGEYTVKSYTTITDRDKFQLIAQNREETYIVGPGIDRGSIEIASASPCFTLPEGVYPGGDF